MKIFIIFLSILFSNASYAGEDDELKEILKDSVEVVEAIRKIENERLAESFNHTVNGDIQATEKSNDISLSREQVLSNDHEGKFSLYGFVFILIFGYFIFKILRFLRVVFFGKIALVCDGCKEKNTLELERRVNLSSKKFTREEWKTVEISTNSRGTNRKKKLKNIKFEKGTDRLFYRCSACNYQKIEDVNYENEV